MTASVHLHWSVSAPVAAALLGGLAWYWRRLGRDGTTVARRRVRRTSILLLAAVVVLGVRGLSFVDPQREGRAYVAVWSALITGILAVVMLAALDILLSMRAHRRARAAVIAEAKAGLVRAVTEARRGAPSGAGDAAAGQDGAPSTLVPRKQEGGS